MTIDEKILINNLIEKYANIMLRCAYSYCGNQADAEDVIQEVFIKYMRKSPIFKDDNHEKAWFLRVTINTAKDYANSFWYRRTEGINENIPSENKDEIDIWELVRKLPQKYRIVIQLFYQEGYSIKEISSILKLRASTVGTQLDRARELLKKMSKEE
jgi:RNA polymerase sigma-70 factor (ECF subfamily)